MDQLQKTPRLTNKLNQLQKFKYVAILVLSNF